MQPHPLPFPRHQRRRRKKTPDEFFRSALSRNLRYCVRHQAKAVNEIADDPGVSPVYVENEAEFPEEYGFLSADKDKCLLNFLISELYDELIASGILDDPDIVCRQTDGSISLTGTPKTDRSFLL